MTLAIRRACLHDAETLFRWRNDPDTYRWFHTPRPVEWDEHVRWLEGIQWRRDISLLVIEDEGRPVGTVRFDLEFDKDKAPFGHVAVSVTVDPAQRGKGYGAKALQLAKSLAFDKLGYRAIFAHILRPNIASIRAFTAAGYVDEGAGMAEEVVLVARRTT